MVLVSIAFAMRPHLRGVVFFGIFAPPGVGTFARRYPLLRSQLADLINLVVPQPALDHEDFSGADEAIERLAKGRNRGAALPRKASIIALNRCFGLVHEAHERDVDALFRSRQSARSGQPIA